MSEELTYLNVGQSCLVFSALLWIFAEESMGTDVTLLLPFIMTGPFQKGLKASSVLPVFKALSPGCAGPAQSQLGPLGSEDRGPPSKAAAFDDADIKQTVNCIKIQQDGLCPAQTHPSH